MPVKRKLEPKSSEYYYNAVKNRYNSPEKIDFRQGIQNQIKRDGHDDVTVDRGNTMNLVDEGYNGANRIRNRPATNSTRTNVQRTKKSVDELLNKRRKK